SNSLIVATTATIGEHALIECDFLCNQQLTCITIKDNYKDKLSIKYCFYYFDIIDELCKKIANQSGGMPIVSLSKMRELSIP
ncbi:restriction endonuclease subunit S, partial [Bacteroides thetaiotaomicron]